MPEVLLAEVPEVPLPEELVDRVADSAGEGYWAQGDMACGEVHWEGDLDAEGETDDECEITDSEDESCDPLAFEPEVAERTTQRAKKTQQEFSEAAGGSRPLQFDFAQPSSNIVDPSLYPDPIVA